MMMMMMNNPCDFSRQRIASRLHWDLLSVVCQHSKVKKRISVALDSVALLPSEAHVIPLQSSAPRSRKGDAHVALQHQGGAGRWINFTQSLLQPRGAENCSLPPSLAPSLTRSSSCSSRAKRGGVEVVPSAPCRWTEIKVALNKPRMCSGSAHMLTRSLARSLAASLAEGRVKKSFISLC